MKTSLTRWPVIILLLALVSCQKDFLNKKPDQSLLVPETLSDFQALLDNSNTIMNFTPYLSEVGSDDLYITDAGFTSQSAPNQNSYIWAEDIFEGAVSVDWNRPYQQVFYSNIVLDGLAAFKTDASNQAQYNQIKGTALFYRAFAFYQVAQLFAAPYDAATGGQDPGIPVRLTSDVNAVSKRGTLQETYDQIILDLKESIGLLPLHASFKTRPSSTAAQAMLARVYQTMENYSAAAEYASASLQTASQLIDYNTLNAAAAKPLPASLPDGNDEVLFYSVLNSNSFISGSASLTSVDTTLYHLYDANDIRQQAFFNNKGNDVYLFKGSYTGNNLMFSGLATDEVFLIRAECYARTGNLSGALQDLNTLLSKRYKTGTFTPAAATDADSALAQILTERRKELICRNTRWTDLRRLNKDPRFAITLTRNLKGQTYSLAPKDAKYVFPIPDNVISTSGIQQNVR
jgi:starch-binding outer membrane protein, SusD/RagB family